MAKLMSTPLEAIENSKAGKYCITDEEAEIAQKLYEEEKLQAIKIVSKEEEKILEDEENMKRYMRWDKTYKPKKTWYNKLKSVVLDAHDSALFWYDNWKNNEKDKTFEEKVEEVRIKIAENRELEEKDPGYEC